MPRRRPVPRPAPMAAKSRVDGDHRASQRLRLDGANRPSNASGTDRGTEPFPAVTGRICTHPCETACNRSAKEGPVAFNAIERAVGDFGIANQLKLSRIAVQPRAEKVAVIGAGPAGLSCAYQLVRRGYAGHRFRKPCASREACCATHPRNSACRVRFSTRRSAAFLDLASS